jgi:thiopeptide-type bacteriocin biosynthesis protein
MPPSLLFHPLVVLRSPAIPFNIAVSRETIREKLSDPFFLEALYLASPDLYQQATRLLTGDQESPAVYAALINYLNRMRSRCTPFGLFAACSLVPWAAAEAITLGATCHRHTRLDMHYVCSLAQALTRSAFLQQHLLYFPNSSYYQAGDQIRYIEYTYENGQRIHQYTSVYASEPLKRILKNSRGGLTQAGLYELIKDPALDPEEVKSYIADLISAQVLISELEPGLTGAEFSYRVPAVLARIQAACPDPDLAGLIRQLGLVAEQLQLLDAGTEARPADYEKISSMLPSLAEGFDHKKLFQVDLIRPPLAGGLPAGLRQELLDFIPLFTKLAATPENPRLGAFRQRFRARYEDRPQALLDVLDPDRGIGYGPAGTASYLPLVSDLPLPQADGASHLITTRRNAAQQFLYRQVRAAERDGRQELQLSPKELAALPENPASLPPSLALIFKVPRPNQIQLEALSGPSAINLISRFAHADAGFEALARSITAQEEANNPGVIFAEILHLPEKRTGNILLRPHLRPFEIPYLAASGLPENRQIHLQDLVVSVKGDRIILFSRTLNREIIPRLGTAHHYTADSLPVYLFLCDLQAQGLQAELSLAWQPDRFDTAFLPRLTCQHFILGLATWQLNRQAFAPLLQADPATLMQTFGDFQKQWGLPDCFTFGEGDRDLLIDARQPDTIRAWLHTIRQRDTIILREFIYDPDQSLVKDAAGHPYASQFIAPLLNTQPAYSPGATPAPAAAQAFPPGSEWLYYKLYGGAQSGEIVLTEALAPLTAELLQRKLIDQWFFLRYQDPEDHLRLRLHLPVPEEIGTVISLVYQYLRPYQEAGLIWKTQTCTYQREIGRYGPGAMGLAEQLFYADSLAVVEYLAQRPEPEAEDQRWIWGLAAIDQLLTCFQFPLAAKLKIIANLKDLFAQEFKQDKTLKLALNQKYRHYRSAMQRDLDSFQHQATTNQGPYHLKSLAVLESVSHQLLALDGAGKLEVPLNELVTSFIHLHINRLIPGQQRLHELLLYEFLYRHYKTILALEGKERLFFAPDDSLF